MKSIRIASCLAATALVLARRDQSPSLQRLLDAVDQLAFGAEHVGGEGSGYFNNIAFYPCLNDGQGEVVWERGQRLDFRRRVYQPSGNQNRSTKSLDRIASRRTIRTTTALTSPCSGSRP